MDTIRKNCKTFLTNREKEARSSRKQVNEHRIALTCVKMGVNTTDAEIRRFIDRMIKLLRAHGGCLGTRSR